MVLNEIGAGRWLTPDLLGGDITNPQSLNRYAYALNNPTTLTDPLGLDSISCTWNPMTSTLNCPGPPPVPPNSGSCDPSDIQCLECTQMQVCVQPAPSGCNAYTGVGCGPGENGGGVAVAPKPTPKPVPPPLIGPAPPQWKPPKDNRPSCASVFASGLGGSPSPTGDFVEQGAKNASTAAAQLAAIYVGIKGLTVPLRSPYFRALTNFGEDLADIGEIAPIAFATREIVPAELGAIKANFTGACQNNFWSEVPWSTITW